MSLVVLFFLMVLAGSIPAFCPDMLGIQGHAPDLWVITVLYLALRAPGYQAVGWGILVGLVRDCVSLDPLGTNGFVLGLLAFFFAEGRHRRGRVDGVYRMTLVGVGVVAASWLYLLRILPFGGGVVELGLFIDALPTALWSAILAGMLFPLLDRYHLLDDLCGRARALPA